MKYFIIAGEQSGDLHGSNLVKELLISDPESEIKCWGGDLMESAGATLLKHYKETNFMGFVTVIKNLDTLNKLLNLCKSQIADFCPDVVILIDYPGFNLRIARFAKKSGFRVFYFISPKLWAWNEKRVEKVKRFVDRMYIIFPFEAGFYKRHGIDAIYMGNPLLDETERKIGSFTERKEIRRSLELGEKPVVSLLAGSRTHEVQHILPVMLEVIRFFPSYQFVIAGVKSLPEALYRNIIRNTPVRLVFDRTYELLYISDAALVASGTATLETALFNVPQVVCFRADFFSILIAWMVIRVKYISLVNLILGYEAVRELIQYDLNSHNLKKELERVLPCGKGRDKMIEDYNRIREILGPSGASARVAKDIVASLKGSPA